MPAEVLDLVSDFILDMDMSSPRPLPDLIRKVQTLQHLRYTCRQMVSASKLYTNEVSPFLPSNPLSIIPTL